MTFERPKGQRITEVVGDYTRILEFRPGWALDPKYGRHGMEMWFYLTGAQGTTYFSITTHLTPNAVIPGGIVDGGPTFGHVLGRCWPTRVSRNDAQSDDCSINKGACFWESGSQVGPVFKRFVTEGPYAVWEELEKYYTDVCAGEYTDEEEETKSMDWYNDTITNALAELGWEVINANEDGYLPGRYEVSIQALKGNDKETTDGLG